MSGYGCPSAGRPHAPLRLRGLVTGPSLGLVPAERCVESPEGGQLGAHHIMVLQRDQPFFVRQLHKTNIKPRKHTRKTTHEKTAYTRTSSEDIPTRLEKAKTRPDPTG